MKLGLFVAGVLLVVTLTTAAWVAGWRGYDPFDLLEPC